MLRLHLAEIESWTDSRGRIRSPFESFPYLSKDSRLVLGREGSEFTLWRAVIIRDGRSPSGPFKAVRVRDDANPALRYSGERLGEDADELNSTFRGVLVALLRWICGNPTDPWRWFLEDRVWDPIRDGTASRERRMVDLPNAVASGVIPDLGLQFRSAGGTYVGVAPPSQIAAALSTWWPSHLGLVAGIRRGSIGLGSDSPRDPDIPAIHDSDLKDVQTLLCTSRPFDNQGWDVAVRGPSWADIKKNLEGHGFASGTLLRDLPFPTAFH
jgi:hypothetical protein